MQDIKKELKELSAAIENLKNLRAEDLVLPIKKSINIESICPNATLVNIDPKTMFVNGFRGKTPEETEQLMVNFLEVNKDKITVLGGCYLVQLSEDDWVATLYSNLENKV